MTPHNGKLSQVFNACAGKVIEAGEFEQLLFQSLKKSLTAEEMTALQRAGDGPLSTPIKDQQAEIRQKVGDGSFGLYFNNHSLYMSSYLLEATLDLKRLPAALSDKVSDAFADAIQQAQDYRDDVKNGKLKPVPDKGFSF